MRERLRHWALSDTCTALQTVPAARRTRSAKALLRRPRAGGRAAAKRQSRQDKQQDKQRRATEWLKQAQQGAEPPGAAGSARRGGALQWLAQQEPQRLAKDIRLDADECIWLEHRVMDHYAKSLVALGITDPKRVRQPDAVTSCDEQFRALRQRAYQHSIDQFQATGTIVPPSRQGLLDDVWAVSEDLVREFGGPAAATLAPARELLHEVGQQVADEYFAAAYRNRFNSAGRSEHGGRSLESVKADFDDIYRFRALSILAAEVLKAQALQQTVESSLARAREREQEMARRAAVRAAEASKQEAESQAEVSPEQQRQQEALRAQRRAEEAIRAVEAQARQVREAEDEQRKAATRLQILSRLQAAAEYRAEEEEVRSQAQAERQKRLIVRQTREYARKHDKLSARQRRIWEAEHRESIEYNAGR